MSRADRFLNACHRRDVDCTPVWLMRQAGRYMPEYRQLRAKYKFLDLVGSPDAAAEVTLQPVRAFDVDAAIIFSDILPLLQGMGIPLEFVAGDGPSLPNPIRCSADIEALVSRPAAETMGATLEAIRIVRQELAGTIPLIGFAGAPFTLASYAIEGGHSSAFTHTKALLYGEPRWWRELLTRLSTAIADLLTAQIDAGAQAVQIFDSWIGALSPADFRESVRPHLIRIVEQVRRHAPNVPIIYFGTGNAGMFADLPAIGADVIGVDWRQDIESAWSIIGNEVAVQGNLDPLLLCSTVAEMNRHTARILDAVEGRRGHIFNLGHGILKQTPPENVAQLVNFVHEYSQQHDRNGD